MIPFSTGTALSFWKNILEEAGELKERIPYEKLVTTTYSEKAAGLQNE